MKGKKTRGIEQGRDHNNLLGYSPGEYTSADGYLTFSEG
jgi:hypothetical protein